MNPRNLDVNVNVDVIVRSVMQLQRYTVVHDGMYTS